MSATDRKDVLQAMTPPAQQIAKKHDKQLAKSNSASVTTYYQLGKDLSAAAKAEKTYGSDFMNQFAKYVGIAPQQLYDYKQMSETLSWQEVEHVMSASNKAGHRVYVGHFVAVAKLGSVAKRRELLKKISEEPITVNQIESLVSASGDKKNTRAAGAGRKLERPASPEVGLKKATEKAVSLAKYLEYFETDVYQKLDEIVPDDVTNDQLAKVQAFQDAMQELGRELDATLGLLEARRTRLENVLRRQEEEASGEDEEEYEDDESASYDDEASDDESDEEGEDDEAAISMAEWRRKASAKPKKKTAKKKSLAHA